MRPPSCPPRPTPAVIFIRTVSFDSSNHYVIRCMIQVEAGLAVKQSNRAGASPRGFVVRGRITSFETLAVENWAEDAVREMLAWLARGGAAFDRAREAFQRGSEEGGLQGGLRAVRRLQIEGAKRGAFGLGYLIAVQSAMIGETEEAMTWLERAYEERDPLLIIVKEDPSMDPLRSDPRFDDLLRRIGFPES